MTAFVKLYEDLDGQPVVSTAGMAVLLGVSHSAVQKHAAQHGSGVIALPSDWVRAGKRRQKEFEAATGESGMKAAIDYFFALEGVRP